MRPRTLWAARLCVLGAAALFSTGGAAIKASAFSAWQVAALRSLFAAPALLLVLGRSAFPRAAADAAAALPYAATMVLFVSANKLTTAASTIFLQSTAPLYLVVLAPWWLGERLRRRDLALLPAFVAGLLAFFADRDARFASAPHPFAGNLLAAAAGLTWALTVTVLRALERRGGGGSAAALVAGNVLVLAACLAIDPPLAPVPLADWALVAYLGVFQIGAAYALLAIGLRDVRAFEASLLLLLEPVMNPVWVWLVHGEVPGPWTVAGAALVLGGTLAKLTLDAREDPRSA